MTYSIKRPSQIKQLESFINSSLVNADFCVEVVEKLNGRLQRPLTSPLVKDEFTHECELRRRYRNPVEEEKAEQTWCAAFQRWLELICAAEGEPDVTIKVAIVAEKVVKVQFEVDYLQKVQRPA